MAVRPLRFALFGLILAGGAKLASIAPLPPHLAEPLTDGIVSIVATPASAADPDGTPLPGPAPHAGDAGADLAACPVPDDLLVVVSQEREAIAADRAALEEERAALEATRLEVEMRTTDLAALRDELAALLASVERTRSADLDRLVNLYRGMKPKQAAAIIADLDFGVTIAILGDMAERDAAPILAQLDPVHAGAISRVILERGKLPSDRDLSNLRLR